MENPLSPPAPVPAEHERPAKRFCSPPSGVAAVFLLCSLAGVLFTISFVQSEHPIHIWDYVGYNVINDRFASLFEQSPLAFLREALGSARTQEYNATPILLPSFIGTALGGGRLSYILSLVLAYNIPLLLLILLATWRWFGDGDPMPLALGTVLTFFLFTMPHFWRQTLRGFPDICTLATLTIAAHIAFTTRVEEKIHVRRMVLMGAMLYLCFLLRRWCGFAMASFYVSYFLASLLCLKREGLGKSILRLCVNAFLSSGTTFILAVAIQYPYLAAVVRDNYAYGYSAYWNAVGWGHFISGHYEAIGPLLLLLIVAAPLILYLERRHGRIVLCLFLFLATYPMSLIVFSGVGPQHKLPFTLFAVFAAIHTLIGADRLLAGHPRQRSIAVGSILALCLALFAAPLMPRLFAGALPDKVFLTDTLRPLRHAGYDGLRALYRDLDLLLAREKGRVAVLASSMILSDNLLLLHGGDALREAVETASHVDKRDGINPNILAARYLVVADPIQCHLLPTDQQVVVIPADCVLRSVGIGAAYSREAGSYDLGSGVTAHIFKKTRPHTMAELEDFLGRFPAESENWPNPPQRADLLFLSMNATLGDIWGRTQPLGGGRLFLHPGETLPTIVTFDNHDMTKCAITAHIPKPLTEVKQDPPEAGRVALTFFADGEKLAGSEIDFRMDQVFSLDLSGSRSFAIQVDPLGPSDSDHVYLTFDVTFDREESASDD